MITEPQLNGNYERISVMSAGDEGYSRCGVGVVCVAAASVVFVVQAGAIYTYGAIATVLFAGAVISKVVGIT